MYGCDGARWANGGWSSTYCNGVHATKDLKWWEVCCVWDGDSCEPRFDSPPPVSPPPSPPAAAARGTCGTLTTNTQCNGNGATKTTLTSDCNDGDGDSTKCANPAACEAAGLPRPGLGHRGGYAVGAATPADAVEVRAAKG